MDEWVRRAYGWTPRDGLRLTASELSDLVHALGLTPIKYEQSGVRTFKDPFSVEEVMSDIEALSGSLEWIDGLSVWATGIEQRVRRLEEQIAALQASAAARPAEPKPARQSPPSPTTPDRPLETRERELIVNAMNALKTAGKNRDFPSVFAEMHRVMGGPTFKSRNFNGYGSAMAMMQRAAAEGIVKFGPLDGNGVPTLFLPDEAITGSDEVAEGEFAEASRD
jgi:hypothetical protein